MNRLPEEIERLVASYLTLPKILLIRCTSHSFRKAVMYHVPHEAFIKGPIRYLMASFPYLTDLKLTRSRKYNEDDFEHLGNIQTLVLDIKSADSMCPSYFKHLHHLKSLKLLGHTCLFNDTMFDGLVSLEKIWINKNTRITDGGIQKLVNLTHLYLHEGSKISTAGLSTMTNLVTLDMYNQYNVTDDVFRYLLELRNLMMTMGCITIEGLLHLKKLETLTTLGCTHLRTFKGLDTLPSLTKVSVTYGSIQDEDLYYLRHVHHLSLLCTDTILGTGLSYLTKVRRLNLHVLKIKDEHVNVLGTFSHIQRIHLYDCPGVSKDKRSQLLEQLPGKLCTD
jgi:hypothetical protein